MIITAAKATDAASILGVELSGLTPETMNAAYRAKSKLCHPDTNDDPEQWARVSWAKECLTRWLATVPAPIAAEPATEGSCRACAGVGRIPLGKASSFGKAMTVMCVMCGGSGAQPSGGVTPHYGRD